jgi:hypothetical protein
VTNEWIWSKEFHSFPSAVCARLYFIRLHSSSKSLRNDLRLLTRCKASSDPMLLKSYFFWLRICFHRSVARADVDIASGLFSDVSSQSDRNTATDEISKTRTGERRVLAGTGRTSGGAMAVISELQVPPHLHQLLTCALMHYNQPSSCSTAEFRHRHRVANRDAAYIPLTNNSG